MVSIGNGGKGRCNVEKMVEATAEAAVEKDLWPR
jgi:hypothetical protein